MGTGLAPGSPSGSSGALVASSGCCRSASGCCRSASGCCKSASGCVACGTVDDVLCFGGFLTTRGLLKLNTDGTACS
ncbi:hypothetical protein ANAPC5_01488 [Anaplasma phagocytophilum]|nr:hypothetical protein ANAPC5_01488 [Anaplasma phagocytophilum]